MSALERSRSTIREMINRKLDKHSTYLGTSAKPEPQRSPPTFEEHVGSQRRRLGETAVLRCSLAQWQHGSCSVTWLRNSFPLQADERITQVFDGRCARLTITRLRPSDLGCYECVAMTTESKCLSTGTLLLEGSLADSTGDVERRTEILQEDTCSILRKPLLTDERREEIKRSVIQRLEAAKNRYSYQPQPITRPTAELSRKKSLHEANQQQNSPRLDSNLQRRATTIRQKLLEWCKIQVRGYKGVEITNFSSSWNDGLAFCALIHRFCPDAFDFDKLDPNDLRHNFQLAFDTATKYGNVTQLLDVEDMIRMKQPDWKCIFMYVESIYRAFAVKKNSKEVEEEKED